MVNETRITVYVLDQAAEFLCPAGPTSKMALSDHDLEAVLSDCSTSLESIVILAELSWEGKFLQDFHGFDIAVDLRRKRKLLCPIIMISTLPKSYFEALSAFSTKYKILHGRGAAFVPLTTGWNSMLARELETLNRYPLTSVVLTDMNEMLLDQKGLVIDKLTHDLKMEKSVEAVLSEVGTYLTSQEKVLLEWEQSSIKLVQASRDAQKFAQIAGELIDKCTKRLVGAADDSSSLPESRKQSKYKILVLEDDSDFRERIERMLGPHFHLTVTGKAENAMECLKSDIGNKITGIISDWRLYEESPNDQRCWQPLQGYEVLDFAARNGFIALFALTSLADANVHNIRNSLGINIHLFKKQHIEQDGDIQWEMMTDTIKQKCTEVTNLIASQPNGTVNWDEVYRKQYIEKRNSEWNVFEAEISREATTILNNYKQVINNPDQLISDIKAYPVEVGKGNNKHGKYFSNVLKIRRVFLALFFMLKKRGSNLQQIDLILLQSYDKLHAFDAYSILHNKITAYYSSESELKQPLKNMDGFLSKLCLQASFPNLIGVLPEEVHWLVNNGVEITRLPSSSLDEGPESDLGSW